MYKQREKMYIQTQPHPGKKGKLNGDEDERQDLQRQTTAAMTEQAVQPIIENLRHLRQEYRNLKVQSI